VANETSTTCYRVPGSRVETSTRPKFQRSIWTNKERKSEISGSNNQHLHQRRLVTGNDPVLRTGNLDFCRHQGRPAGQAPTPRTSPHPENLDSESGKATCTVEQSTKGRVWNINKITDISSARPKFERTGGQSQTRNREH